MNAKIIAPFEFDGYPLHGSSVLSPLVPCVVVFMGKGRGWGGEELRRIRTLFCNYHPVTLPSTYSRLRSEAFYSLLLPSVYPTRNFGLGPSIASSFRASWLLLTTYSPTNEPYSALAKSFNSEDTLCIAYFFPFIQDVSVNGSCCICEGPESEGKTDGMRRKVVQ